MNCSEFETLLLNYLDEELDGSLHRTMSEHRRTCPLCDSLVREVRSLEHELANFPVLELPDDLVDRILESTSGKRGTRSVWGDLVVPTMRPFLTARYAFATLTVFVFLTFVLSFLGPNLSTVRASDLRPSAIVQKSYRISNEFYKQWMRVREMRMRLIEEFRFLTEDLYARLDHYLISILFENYSRSLEEEQESDRQQRE